MAKNLNTNELKILESYWMDYQERKEQIQVLQLQNKTDTPQYHYLTLTVNAVESLINTLDEDTRTIVHKRYWDTNEEFCEWEEISDVLFISRRKVLQKRDALMLKTAKLIGWK